MRIKLMPLKVISECSLISFNVVFAEQAKKSPVDEHQLQRSRDETNFDRRTAVEVTDFG